MTSDKELLEWYIRGFKDEIVMDKTSEQMDNIQNIAYDLGRMHATRCDKHASEDYLSDEELLKLIKG